MVFARKTDDALASLVKQIDAVVAANENQKMASFVTFLGDDPAALKPAVEKLAAEHKIENVALTVATGKDPAAGPKNMKVSPEAEVTVVIYKNRKVEANHALAPGKLNEEAIKKIVADTSKILE